VAHIEAGLRSFDMTMPEEINRKLTDAVSSLLFVTEQSGVENLRREGVPDEKIFLVGNVMIDSLLQHRELAARSPILDRLGVRNNGSDCRPYGVLTLHRPSNVDDPKTLQGILEAVSVLATEFPVSFPFIPELARTWKVLVLDDIWPVRPQGTAPESCLLIPLDISISFRLTTEHALSSPIPVECRRKPLSLAYPASHCARTRNGRRQCNRARIK